MKLQKKYSRKKSTKDSRKKIIKNKKQIKKGGAVYSSIPQCMNPTWRPRLTTLVRLLDIDGAKTPLHIYGSSLPVNNRTQQVYTLLYYNVFG
jgi:hypothetical protein